MDTLSEEKDIKLVLLSPQVRYLEKKLSEMLMSQHILVRVISMKDYGEIDGEKIIERLLQALS